MRWLYQIGRMASTAMRSGTALLEKVCDELLVAAGLVLVAVGFWDFWRPGAFVVPGIVLLYMGLPSRAAFLTRLPDHPGRRRSDS